MTQPGITNLTRQSDQYLSICQQNVNRSLTVKSDFLHQLDPDIYDFATIQEPYLDSNHNSCATHHWYTFYPKEHYVMPLWMRSISLVNRQLASDAWSQVDASSSDMTALVINTGKGKVLLTNMYNDIRQQQGLEHSIQAFQKRLHVGGSEGHMEQMIWLGDFNLHHLQWDKECNGHLFMRGNLEKSQVLIDVLAEFDLQMALPKDVPTLQALSTGNHTRPDNVFISLWAAL